MISKWLVATRSAGLIMTFISSAVAGPLALKRFALVFTVYRRPKPEQRPDAYPADSWPLWYVAFAFVHNRRFGLLFLLGLIGEVVLRSVWK